MSGTSTIRNGERHQHFAETFPVGGESKSTRKRDPLSPSLLSPHPSLLLSSHTPPPSPPPPSVSILAHVATFLCCTVSDNGNCRLCDMQSVCCTCATISCSSLCCVLYQRVCWSCLQVYAVSFVPTGHALRSCGEQFEGFGVRWVSAFESHDVKDLRACAGRGCFWVVRV